MTLTQVVRESLSSVGEGHDTVSPPQPTGPTTAKPDSVVGGEDFLLIRFHADLLDEFEDMRKRLTNRLNSLTRDDEYGKAIPPWHPHIITAQASLDNAKALEREQTKYLELAFRDLPEPIVRFVDETPGLAFKGVGRWLGTVGNPAWHSRDNRPRKLRELYAYMGLHVVDGQAPRNRRGQQSNWNGKARMRAYNMADPAIKASGKRGQRSPYRDVYEFAKVRYQARDDAAVLPQAQIHARARRIVMKRIVKDLWTVAHISYDSQVACGGGSEDTP